MTMIELCVVMGIATMLMAMVLGLGRHVNAVVKIRRAQADLGEWHETIERWHLQFGEYPSERVDLNGTSVPLLEPNNPSANLSNLLSHCYVQFDAQGTTTNITLRSFMTSAVKHIDPWGTPYIYDCDPGGKAYTLFSCGPDSSSMLNGKLIGSSLTPNTTPLDDIYFER